MKQYQGIYKALLPVCFFVIVMLSNAQPPATALAQLQKNNPIEKMYLQLDRDNYISGQTLWLKGYFMSGMLPSTHNSTLFVELLNNQSRVILKKVLPVLNAITYGQLDLPDTLKTGSYQLRAYTPLMLNQDKNLLFSQRIDIYGKEKMRGGSTGATLQQVSFYPEGGHFVSGLLHTVAFKATDTNDLPIDIKGLIKDSKGNTITSFSALHDGMGSFILKPVTGETYRAEISGTNKTYLLPDAVPGGLGFHVTQQDRQLSFLISKNGTTPDPKYMIGDMQHDIVINQPLTTGSGLISTAALPSGILHLTVFSASNTPLAERLVFIDNREYKVQASLVADTINTGNRKLNSYQLVIDQPLSGDISVSVSDADYEPADNRAQNIISRFLLTSDLADYVHNPAYYFNDNNKDARQALDLLMLTNTWKRFSWDNIATATYQSPGYTDPGFISLSGKVTVRDTKKPFANKDLFVWVAAHDSARGMDMVKTDAEGRFRMDSFIFFNKARILFSDVMGKKSKAISVKLNTDSLTRTYNLPSLHIPYVAGNTAINTGIAGKMYTAYADYTRGEGLLLDNVAVEGRKYNLRDLESRYMSGLFAGGINARTYDLTHTFIPQWNIFEYLMGRIPSLRIERSGNFYDNYKLYYRQAGNQAPMQLYLDEMLMTDASFIATIPASQIALVKLFPTFVGAPGNGAGGVLAIYTKRGFDIEEDGWESTGEVINYDGYSLIKEFPETVYNTKYRGNDLTDYRLTLDWKPEIVVNGQQKNIPIRFYNNDRTRRFKITVEGFTNDGRFVLLEQIVGKKE